MTVSVCTESPAGGDRRWLLSYGQVTGLTYDTIVPGGCKSMQGTLLCGPNFHGIVMAPGRVVKAFCGGWQVWQGTLDEPTPQPDGIAFSATGNMALGDDYVAIPSGVPTTGGNELSVDSNLDAATARGLPWVRVNNCPGLYGYGDPGGTLNTMLQDAMNLHGQPWFVDAFGNFFWFTYPTTPSMLLTAVTTGGGRTRDGMATDVGARYLNSSGVAVTSNFAGNTKLRAMLGRKEKMLDLTGRGNASASTLPSLPAEITAAINAESALNGQRAAWTGSFPAPRGLLRTVGGAPVEPAMVLSGQMVGVQMEDVGLWGESIINTPTFIIGQTSYDQDSDSVVLTPLQSTPNSLAVALRR